MSLLPNPADASARLTVSVPTAADLSLELFDASGRAVMKTGYPASVGTFRETLNLETFADGVYLLKVQIGQSVTTHRLVIDHP